MKLRALILVTGTAALLGSAAAAAQASGPSCSLVSAKTIKAAVGVTVRSPVVTKNGPVTVCDFLSATPLLVRFETRENATLFAVGRKGFSQHGEPTKTVGGLGNAAYSSSLAGGKANTIVILKGSTELLITGPEPLPKLETLAKLILPAL